jgi:hypothetical protein
MSSAGLPTGPGVADWIPPPAQSVAELRTLLAAYGKGKIHHGNNPDIVRGTDFASYEWEGTVEPLNAIDGDTWVGG